MNGQLKADIVSEAELEQAIKWLITNGFQLVSEGTFEKGNSKAVLHFEGIFIKKGKSTLEGIGVREMIQLLK